MLPKRRIRWTAAATLVALASLGVHSCGEFGLGSPFLFFKAPLLAQLSLPDAVDVELRVGFLVDRDSLEVTLDGAPLALEGGAHPDRLVTTLTDVDEGVHQLEASATAGFGWLRFPLTALTRFEVTELERPDECEILNDAHCYLPFPSARFLEEVGDETETGFRAKLPPILIRGLEDPPNPPLDPAPYNVYDGFTPTVQILVHLPGADPEASNASRLLPGVPQSAPYVGVRTHDLSSLDHDSPTVLLDVDTGERVLHWIELDQNEAALADPDRQVLFLRPAEALVPGHRYVVAFRRMKDASGERIAAEATFRALRDARPSTIPALEARRHAMEDVFRELWHAGVPRRDLQLAFDFRVRSQTQLQERLLAMRDESLAWLGGLAPDDVSGFANVEIVQEGDCSAPDERIWRWVRGTFDGPNYMDGDINNPFELVLLNVDADRQPVRNGEFPFNWDLAVTCAVFRGEAVGHPLLLGHGFLGDGRGFVQSFVEGGGGVLGGEGAVEYIAGATDWRGLALGITGPDAISILLNVIGTPASGHKFNDFQALPERLKQGMVNTLVLSRMMKSGFFNRLPEFQRTPGDPSTGIFLPEEEMFYFGVSLGGIQGALYAALNQDVIRHNIDVPGTIFPLLEQRSTQFPVFLDLIANLGLTDPMELAVILTLQHEIWGPGEIAGFMRNVTGLNDPPVRDTPPKKLLMTVSWLDYQVSNHASEILARTLRIPNLVGSLQQELPNIPDVDGGVEGLDSALVIYDVGDLDPFDPAFEPFIPPLANRIVAEARCDPHGGPRLTIPAAQEQIRAFLQPGGTVQNFCDGICDAQEPEELPDEPCDVFAP